MPKKKKGRAKLRGKGAQLENPRRVRAPNEPKTARIPRKGW